jgi:uncharacterized protein YbaR (Trm112 family)
MLKVCPVCHGVYERQNLTCPTCKKQLVTRERRQTDNEPKDAISRIKKMVIALITSHTIIDLTEDPFGTGSWIKLAGWLSCVIWKACEGIVSWRRRPKSKLAD